MRVQQLVDKQADNCCWKAKRGYDIDGRAFLRLWELVFPYVKKSVERFIRRYPQARLERYEEDLIADIREKIYMYLRKYGSRHKNFPFHKTIRMIEFEFFARLRRDITINASTKLSFHTISFDVLLDRESHWSSTPFSVDYAEAYDTYLDVSMNVPKIWKDIFTELYRGEPYTVVAKRHALHPEALRRKLKKVFPR